MDNSELRLLTETARGEGVAALFLTGEEKLKGVLEYVMAGNEVQMGDRAWVEELKGWIRFNAADAIQTGDGLHGRSMGNPDVPGWLGNFIMRFALSAKKQNEKDRNNLLGSAGVVVFYSESDDRKHWVEAGRCFQRFALQAEALDIRTAFINPPVEVKDLRHHFASWLGIGDRRPDLVVRFGHRPTMPPSVRRPVEEVILR